MRFFRLGGATGLGNWDRTGNYDEWRVRLLWSDCLKVLFHFFPMILFLFFGEIGVGYTLFILA